MVNGERAATSEAGPIPGIPTEGAAADPAVPAPSDWIAEGRAWLSRMYVRAQRAAADLGVKTEHFLIALTGAFCLVLLLLSTLLSWEVNSFAQGKLFVSKGTSGLDFAQGKYVCFLSLAGVMLFAAVYFVRTLLPWSLSVASAIATCSLLLALSANHGIERTRREMGQAMNIMAGSMAATTGAKVQDIEKAFVPQYEFHQGLGLSLALFASLVAIPSLVFGALLKPAELASLQKDSVHPFARKHGVLLICQAVAVLAGLWVYINRY